MAMQKISCEKGGRSKGGEEKVELDKGERVAKYDSLSQSYGFARLLCDTLTQQRK